MLVPVQKDKYGYNLSNSHKCYTKVIVYTPTGTYLLYLLGRYRRYLTTVKYSYLHTVL